MVLRSRSLILLFFLSDILILTCAYTIVGYLHYKALPVYGDLYFVLIGSWIITYFLFLGHGFFDVQSFFTQIRRLLRKFFVFLSLCALSIILFDMDKVSRAMYLGSSLYFIGLKLPAIYLYAYLISIRKHGPFYNKILIAGAGKLGEAIQSYYKMNPNIGTMIGFLDDNKVKSEKLNVLGKLSQFQEVFNQNNFNEVIVTLDLSKEEEIKSLVKISEYNGVRPSIVANYYSLFNRNFELKSFAGIPIVGIREVPLDPYTARFWKGTFDILLASFGLIVLSPILILAAIAIKLDSKGPVFYKPIRIGKHGLQFGVYKFRSMRINQSTTDQQRSTSKDDDRITRVGKFIRKYSIDELPQLINVLRGEMSIVGPRPHRIDLNKRFQQNAQSYLVRQYIKPGITGWAQVNGWRGPTETKHQYVGRTLHDLWYIEHWNFALDIYIIFLTVFGRKTRSNAF